MLMLEIKTQVGNCLKEKDQDEQDVWRFNPFFLQQPGH